MIEALIKNIFHTEDYSLVNLDKGHTNQNFLLTVKQKKYVVRIPYDDHASLFQRNHEKEVLDLVIDLDVPVIYFNETSGIKITKYIEYLKEYSECCDENKIERCATMLKKLHQKPTIEHNFDPIQTLVEYKHNIQSPIFDITEYEYIIEQVKTMNHPLTLCHNDIVSGNLLFGEHQDYLIDYEYAGNNDPLFDVMSFISENNIEDSHLRERFYNAYFDEITNDIRKSLHVWEAFHNLLWCYWAMMLFESRQQNIYYSIAKDKYVALKKMNNIKDI